MRLRLFAAVVVVLSLAFLFELPEALSQPGRGKGKGGFGGGFPGGFPSGGMRGPGGGMMMGDPSRLFDMLAKGRDHFLISETKSLRTSLMEFAASKGLKDDKITRELFSGYSTYMQTKMGIDPSKAGASPAPGAAPGAGAAPTGNQADAWHQWAEMEFQRRDQNGDKFLNFDEMPGNLKDELARWDSNRDNLIDFNEYKTHFLARIQERFDRDVQRFNPSANPVAASIIIEEEWDKRPVVYRAGKLPPGLPKWFTELDRDEDGQVSLAEWRRNAKDMSEFAGYDRNDDGLLTPAEILRNDTLAKNGTQNGPQVQQGGSIVNSAIEAGRWPQSGEGRKKFDWGGKDWRKKGKGG